MKFLIGIVFRMHGKDGPEIGKWAPFAPLCIKDCTVIVQIFSRLAELESGRALDRAAIEMQNTSYMRLEANVTALADAISTIEANNGGLDQLGLYKNETEALDSRLTYLEGNSLR